LTIHKSKGLEFPIVILSGLSKKSQINSEEKSDEDMKISTESVEFSLPDNNIRYFVLKKLFFEKNKKHGYFIIINAR
jgi:ATP-dependent helicase/nuclease subunit A